MIELAEMVRELRRELGAAMADGVGEAVRFELGPVEIEATVAVERAAEGSGKVRFWVVEAGGGGKDTRSRTQRITLTLQPVAVGPDGTPRSALISGGEVDGER
ncbi:trypco2 family protein [Streptomyces sp. NPDC088789]|uniref:trypco2 family protein n=1 Tax=Streptomyces sp. NPDC088789 TaxID=3365899 RepID=UPI00380360AC